MKFTSIPMRDGSRITLPKPENYRDCITLIQSDFFRKNGKILAPAKIFCKAFFHPLTHFLIWFRLSQHRGILYPLTASLYRRCEQIHKVSLPIRTQVGYGLDMGHHTCMFINSKTIIGNNVNLAQFLNIGSNRETPAVIGDQVYIGPMVCLVEDVHIGSNTTIGAGAVITRDLPQESVAVGVPARVIRQERRTPKYSWPVPEMPDPTAKTPVPEPEK